MKYPIKKFLSIVLIGIMLIALASCGSETTTQETAVKKDTSSTLSKEASETEDTDEDKSSSADNVSPEFKEAMDSYEAFFDEYIAFMKKYKNSDDVTGMLSDYNDYLNKYSDTMDKMKGINIKDLSVADAAYYTEVTSRITKKLADISQ